MRALIISSLVLMAACGSSETANAPLDVSLGISTATLVSRSAALALDAVVGVNAPCASVSKACGTAFPCEGEATIALGPSCPLPLGGEAGGTVKLSGTWASATEATLTAEFTGVKTSTSKEAAVAKVKAIAVERNTDFLSVHYSATDATPRTGIDPIAVGSGGTWEVVIDSRGTADPADDGLTITSTAANTEDWQSHALDMSGAVISADCTKNPTSGSGTFTGLSGLIPAPKVVAFEFHSACDGNFTVDGKTEPMALFPR
jgi:hypothetical protein